MNIIIAGGSGLIGEELIKSLLKRDYSITLLSRTENPALPSEILDRISVSKWNTDKQVIDESTIENSNIVINLSGQNIAEKRWTAQRKEELLNSRILSTKLLAKTITKVKKKPELFISASAIGYYKPTNNEIISEESPHGDNFISKICIEWEKEAILSPEHNIRCIQTRIGIVLTKKGGALKKMLLPFKLGLGGRLGSGNQYMSWISIDDIIDSILYCIDNQDIEGPVNLCSPKPVTNLEFTKTLGKVLSRPTIFPVPKIALRILLGEMADQLLLSSLPVIPQKLLKSGFKFKHTNLENTLKELLN